MTWRRIVSPGILAAAVAAFAGVAIAQNPAEEQGGKAKVHNIKVYTIADEAARTLKNVEETAYEVTDHAGTIHIATGALATSREFNLTQLQALKDDVNSMGQELARLEALQPEEKAWERRAVTRFSPMLKELAATTTEAIRFVDESPSGKLGMQDYRNLTKKLYDQSTTLWKALHDSVRLADLRMRESRLKKDLRTADQPK